MNVVSGLPVPMKNLTDHDGKEMKLMDSRRLTGANLYWDRPSAIIDVSIDAQPGPVIEAWQRAAEEWLDKVGYADEKTCFRVFDGGASLLISAPDRCACTQCAS